MDNPNPYASPKEDGTVLDATRESETQMLLLRMAARFALYVPLFLFLMGSLITTRFLLGLFLLLLSVAFAVGIVAVSGGILARDTKIVCVAAFGMLLSSFPLSTMIGYFMRWLGS